MKQPLFWLVLVLIYTSCATKLHKAQDQYKLHPEDFAELTARYYPCRDTVITRDSLRLDTLYLQELPDTVITFRADTVFITVPGTTRFITKTVRHDSIIIRRDNAAEAMLRQIISQRDKVVADTTAEYASLKSSRSWFRLATFITWGILLALLIGFIFAKIYGK